MLSLFHKELDPGTASGIHRGLPLVRHSFAALVWLPSSQGHQLNNQSRAQRLTQKWIPQKQLIH